MVLWVCSFCTSMTALQLWTSTDQKSKQVINRAPAVRIQRGAAPQSGLLERTKKASRRENNLPASLCRLQLVGKWLIFARTLNKEKLSSTILDAGFCCLLFFRERRKWSEATASTKTRAVSLCTAYLKVPCNKAVTTALMISVQVLVVPALLSVIDWKWSTKWAALPLLRWRGACCLRGLLWHEIQRCVQKNLVNYWTSIT